MSNPSRLLTLSGLVLVVLYASLFANGAHADPSGRVGYLSDSHGLVSYSPSGEEQWTEVMRNRPLIRGDRLWTDRGARAEFQVGSSAVRIDANSSVEILDLNDRITQLQLTQGTLSLSVRRQYRDQLVEIDTPLLAFTINGSGRYRIDVDPRSGATSIRVWEGMGEVYGDDAHFSLRAGDMVRFYDADLHDYQMFGLPREDDFDRYCLDRDQRLQRAESLRYVDDDLVGYSDLDEYGSWRPVSGHGHVWFPSRISVGWAPYRDGHWTWQEPWGWTWVDNAPWGFAPSHYGRWIYVRDHWGWIPCPRRVRPIYAPALVAFIGGSGWSLTLALGGSAAPIGWFPLGPREVYVPSYHVSRDYFTRVNLNNTVINTTTIINVYNNYSSGTINTGQVNYVNRQLEQAVTVVPSSVFVNAQPVHAAALRVDRQALAAGETLRIAPIAPSKRSVIGSAEVAKAHPASEVFDRRVVARNAPPPAEAPFSLREKRLQQQPGQALEPAAVESLPDSSGQRRKNVQVLGEPERAVDVRSAQPRRADDSAQPPELDRSAEAQRRPERDNDPEAMQPPREEQQPRDIDSDPQATQQQQEQLQRQGERERQGAQQQRQIDDEQQGQQRQEQLQRQVESERQAAQQQRQADEEQQAQQRQEQLQRQADDERQAAQQQRRAEEEQQAQQRQEQLQRQVERERQAAQQQRQAEEEQQGQQRQEQLQRQVERERQAAQQQRRDDEQRAQQQHQEQLQRQIEREQQRRENAPQQREPAAQPQLYEPIEPDENRLP